ncbi:MAG TPA: hypothetical protein VNT01_06060 [Symbiobacteriaceae bacterium]|nr:hypothetical protein [Symbiobacteriaceae bacterium]
MSEKNNGAFVNLIRKAVGLPTGTSSCCGAPAAGTQSSCCSTPTTKESETAKDQGGCCN